MLIAGLLASLAANLPGHMSADSVIALDEARTGVRQTWAPAAFSAVLRIFDNLLSGTGLYVAAASGLLFASLMTLPSLRPRTGWGAVALAALAVLTPQLLIYQGIVWRDVLFADLIIAGFVLLARADVVWVRRRDWLSLAGAALCLSLAAAVRQNGVVMLVAATVALGWMARRGGWRAVASWSLGSLALTLSLALGINALSQPLEAGEDLRPGAEVLILQHYDVVGALAHEPGLQLREIAAAAPANADRITAWGPKVYSPARADTLEIDPQFRRALWTTPDLAMHAQWRDVVTNHTAAYLAHRWDMFRWVLETPDIGQCLPVQTGVAGPLDVIQDLELDSAPTPKDAAMRAYAAQFYGTPVFSHLTFAAAALVFALLLLRRSQPGDGVLAALLLGVLAFTATFFVIAVGCDYRNLYVLDLAAITGALYLALDPSGTLRRSSRSAGSCGLTKG